MNKKVLVTGGAGFIGANLVRKLVADGERVCVFVRPGSDLWRLEAIKEDIEIFETDLSNAGGLRSILDEIKPKWIFHLAAFGAYSWQTDVNRMIETNIRGTFNLIEACQSFDFEAFINTGTSSEYGFKNYPHRETDFLEPYSPYAVTKASATMFCSQIARLKKVPILTLRPYSVYGPYEDQRRLIPQLISKGLKGQWPPLVDQNVAHDFVYIGDICEAFILAASYAVKIKGEVFNVGTGKQFLLKDVVAIAKNLMKIKESPQWGTMTQRQWDSEVWVGENQKIKKQLGWVPQISFEEGFQKSLEWQQSFYS